MGSFMTSGSLTWDAELDEGPDRSDMTPFPEEKAIKTIYGGGGATGKLRMSNLSPRAPTCCSWGHEGSLYIYMLKCILQSFRGAKEKGKWKGDGVDDPKPRVWWPTQVQSHRPAPEASASFRHSKMRPATGKTSRADFQSWGMS
jgi:hypothetical protein